MARYSVCVFPNYLVDPRHYSSSFEPPPFSSLLPFHQLVGACRSGGVESPNSQLYRESSADPHVNFAHRGHQTFTSTQQNVMFVVPREAFRFRCCRCPDGSVNHKRNLVVGAPNSLSPVIHAVTSVLCSRTACARVLPTTICQQVSRFGGHASCRWPSHAWSMAQRSGSIRCDVLAARNRNESRVRGIFKHVCIGWRWWAEQRYA